MKGLVPDGDVVSIPIMRKVLAFSVFYLFSLKMLRAFNF